MHYTPTNQLFHVGVAAFALEDDFLTVNHHGSPFNLRLLKCSKTPVLLKEQFGHPTPTDEIHSALSRHHELSELQHHEREETPPDPSVYTGTVTLDLSSHTAPITVWIPPECKHPNTHIWGARL